MKRDRQRQQRMEKYHGCVLYIKNLDDTINNERLKEEFSKFGTITSATVMCENGRSKGFGFVRFSAPEEATRAAIGMNSVVVGSKALYVALAQRKEERRMHLTNQHMQRITISSSPTDYNLILFDEQDPITEAILANAAPPEPEQMLGERLFPLIQQIQVELTNEITDILLESDHTELLRMLESHELLKAKVLEAIIELRTSETI